MITGHSSALAAILILLACLPAWAEMVEVAPGLSIARKTYQVEANEAPFFNFVDKSDEQEKRDQEFVAGILGIVPDRAKAARQASSRGWELIQRGDFAAAAKRFNQAYLLDPADSALYHGFAVVVFERFRDVDYADELFKAAAKTNYPYSTLSADHGRVLLIAGRPADAMPLLEKGMRENPKWGTPRVNLAWARLQTGNGEAACELISTIAADDRSADQNDIALLRERANCN